MLKLYAVTDRSWAEKVPLLSQVEEALQGGVTCVQIREKDLPEDLFLREAAAMRELCGRYKVPFIVNDNVNIALACGAGGVHVGQSDLSVREARKLLGGDKIVGASVSTVEEALFAEECGADYLGVGAVFATATKPDAAEVSFQVLRDICQAVSIPVVAIGGITRDNILSLTGSGVAGVAVVSAIFGAKDPKKAAAELLTLSQKLTGA